MSQIAGLQDFRQEGPPADIGTFQFPASIIVFKHVFAGTTYVCAVRAGVRGWVLVDYDTDASTVIQQAIDALTSGGKIFIKEGTYLINTSIQLGNNITLQGEGESTILRGNSESLLKILVNDWVNGNNHITLRDFQIDGNRIATLAGDHGIEFRRMTDCTIENLHIHHTGCCGIVLYLACSRNWILNNEIDHYYDDSGIVAYGEETDLCYDNKIVNNVIHDGGNWGISFYSAYDYLVVGNTVRDASTSGIIGAAARRTVIGSNFVEVCGEGINLCGSDNSILDNKCFSSTIGDGIKLPFWCSSTQIIGNRVYGNAGSGINLDQATVDGTLVSLNVVWGNTGVGIINNGVNSIITKNPGFVTENSVLSPAFAIDGVALVTVTIPHGLAVTPAIEDCSLTVVEDTNVDDWGYNLLKVDNVGAVNVVAKVNVSVASATGGATAKLSLRVGKA